MNETVSLNTKQFTKLLVCAGKDSKLYKMAVSNELIEAIAAQFDSSATEIISNFNVMFNRACEEFISQEVSYNVHSQVLLSSCNTLRKIEKLKNLKDVTNEMA
jgi:hypothetical protein